MGMIGISLGRVKWKLTSNKGPGNLVLVALLNGIQIFNYHGAKKFQKICLIIKIVDIFMTSY